MEKKFLTKEDIPEYLKEEIVNDRVEYIRQKLKKEHQELMDTFDEMHKVHEKMRKEMNLHGYIIFGLTIGGLIINLFLL